MVVATERAIRCAGRLPDGAACNNYLGVYQGPAYSGLVAIRHRGREILVAQVIAIRCEACGTPWTPAPPRWPAPGPLEVK